MKAAIVVLAMLFLASPALAAHQATHDARPAQHEVKKDAGKDKCDCKCPDKAGKKHWWNRLRRH